MGRRSRKYPLRNEGQAEALRYFLYKEIFRHRLDIRRAKKDIRKSGPMSRRTPNEKKRHMSKENHFELAGHDDAEHHFR